jgi:hypothetical protein
MAARLVKASAVSTEVVLPIRKHSKKGLKL